MDEIEFELRRVLAGDLPLDNGKAEAMKKELGALYDRKLRTVKYWMYGYLVLLAGILVFALTRFYASTDLKDCLLYAAMAVIMYDGTVLMKLWFYVKDAKIATVREIKQMQVQLAELAARLPSPPASPRA